MPDSPRTPSRPRRRSRARLAAGPSPAAPPEPVRPLALVVHLLTRRPVDDPSATRFLAHDHHVVRALLRQLEDVEARGGRSRRDVVDQVRRALDVHTRITEKIFLPACSSIRDVHVRSLVAESFEAHRIVRRLVAEIGALSPLDGRYDAKVAVLTRFVVQQLAEEERDLFPEVEKAWPGPKLETIGLRLRRMKARLADGP